MKINVGNIIKNVFYSRGFLEVPHDYKTVDVHLWEFYPPKREGQKLRTKQFVIQQLQLVDGEIINVIILEDPQDLQHMQNIVYEEEVLFLSQENSDKLEEMTHENLFRAPS